MKENILQNFCFIELQDGTGIDYACSSWTLLPIKVGLSPFLLMDLYLILHYYSCTAYGLGFQHLPRDLANVNAWKTMFDPYIKISGVLHCLSRSLVL